jgi:hypothetical protein
MKSRQKLIQWSLLAVLLSSATMLAGASRAQAQQNGAPGVPVRMTVTANVADGKRLPELNAEDVQVKRGDSRLQVHELVPAKGDRAGLDLFVLVDDAADSSLGTHLDELRAFVKEQPSTTSIGVGYMRNATVQIVQNFTTDKEAAAKAIRLPLGSAGAYGSPYLSVIDLMKRWPDSSNRREVLMITDGGDRARGGARHGLSIDPDVYSASAVAQRTGTVIHAIYTPGVGRMHRNFFATTNGQTGIAKLAEETGGESFYMGRQAPVSFGPYLEQLQRTLNNQYLLTFSATPEKKAGPQYVSLSTEIAGVEFAAADSVWVSAAAR